MIQMAPPTAAAVIDLDTVRARLRRLVERRITFPLNPQEQAEYAELCAMELCLLTSRN